MIYAYLCYDCARYKPFTIYHIHDISVYCADHHPINGMQGLFCHRKITPAIAELRSHRRHPKIAPSSCSFLQNLDTRCHKCTSSKPLAFAATQTTSSPVKLGKWPKWDAVNTRIHSKQSSSPFGREPGSATRTLQWSSGSRRCSGMEESNWALRSALRPAGFSRFKSGSLPSRIGDAWGHSWKHFCSNTNNTRISMNANQKTLLLCLAHSYWKAIPVWP